MGTLDKKGIDLLVGLDRHWHVLDGEHDYIFGFGGYLNSIPLDEPEEWLKPIRESRTSVVG